ncbi:hypothetical protein J7I80_13605 [Bacillus sp. ISL-41]|uniref:hypothetical protein n=1 Tax=Bacillus sp. ISL-41 TaxID=2819127 RepID=UPI001BE6A530|nr:hypothetical protein [Bacillus sp. ISL-41]MBT2643270.1 hypothetical protein [Bacillus sp. ISL-41]
MATSRAIVYVGQMGADTFTQALEGVLYTEDQIGFMADRILWTEGQIGVMADRIVYVVELSQFNTIEAMYMGMNMSFMGMDSMMNNMFRYAISVNPVSYIPWLSRGGYANPYQSYPNTYFGKE